MKRRKPTKTRDIESHQAACMRKIAYADREAAEAFLQESRGGQPGWRVYRCHWCNGWHITSNRNGLR